MESNNNDGSSSRGMVSFYHPQLHHQATSPSAGGGGMGMTPTNGVVSLNSHSGNVLYPQSVPSAAISSPLEKVKRKRGRPRKYGTPEQAAAAKRLSSSAVSPRKRDAAAGASGSGNSAHSTKKSQLASYGNGGGFSPHVITVAAGEDVNQKIMMFMQQYQREICIISASGSVSNASLRQPATSGGNVTYEGQFDIVSLSGSYVRTENGGKTGGLGVCLCSSDGQLIGGAIGGPLTAAVPIEIMVLTFLYDAKKDIIKEDAASCKLPSPVGVASISDLNFLSPVDSAHQMMGGGQYIVQNQSMQLAPPHTMEWRGNTGLSMHQSPEAGDYNHISL